MTRAPKPPTNEQLIRRYRRGEREALDALLEKNRGLAHKMAYKFTEHDPASYDDAVQEACLTIMHCADKFRSRRKCKFITFAWTSVFRRLQSWSSQQDVVRVPHSAQERGVKRLGMIGSDSQELADYVETMPDGEPLPWEQAADNEERRRWERMFRRRFNRLGEREQEIITARLAGETLETIGRRLGVSKERVRQVEGEALKELGVREVV